MGDPGDNNSGSKHATPSQTVGPFFSIGLCARTPDNLVPEQKSEGAEIVTIRGRILDGDGQGVPDAILEIWRAGENGEFAESGAGSIGGVPPGFARIPTNDLGEFEFRTVTPGRVKSSDEITSTPHLTVLIFMRGLLRHLLTRLYFPEEGRIESDFVLASVPAERRETLIAVPHGERGPALHWDVHLQGDDETVFFEA